MKILALGATGAIGSQLVTQLSAFGHDLRVTSRRPRPDTPTVRYQQGNAHDPAFLRELLKDHWDVIVDFMVYSSPAFAERVEELLSATNQYIFVSSGRVFHGSAEPITETTPRLLDISTDIAFLATDEYALSKARQEDLLRATGHCNWTIVRPYITFGEKRFQLGTLEKEAWLYRVLHGRSIVFCDALMDRITTLTDGAEVARMIAALVGEPAALAEDFNLVGQQSMTWGEVLALYLDALERHLGQRPKVVQQGLEDFCAAAVSVPQVMYDRNYDRRFNPAKISEIVGFEATDDIQSTLQLRFRHMLSTGPVSSAFRGLNPRGEALRDRAAGEWTGLSEFLDSKQKLRYFAYRSIPLGLINRLRSLS